jgi:holo-[acyl-carrier protein] synthase
VTVPEAGAGAATGTAAGAGAATGPAVGSGAMVGLGLDSVELPRFAAVLARRAGMRHRLFTGEERADVADMVDPVPTLAGRFAAKEAVMKSLGVGLGAFDWWDVEVRRLPSGQPDLVVRGRAAALAARAGVGSWRVSITHTDRTASAVVAALA